MGTPTKSRIFWKIILKIAGVWLILAGLGVLVSSDQLVFLWNPYLDALTKVIFWPFYILPEGVFYLNGGFVSVPNIPGVAFSILLSAISVYGFFHIANRLASKMNLKLRGWLPAFVLLIVALVFGSVYMQRCLDGSYDTFDGQHVAGSHEGNGFAYDNGFIRLIDDSAKDLDPEFYTKGKIFYRINGLLIQETIDLPSEVKNLDYVRVEVGDEKKAICKINSNGPYFSAPAMSKKTPS